MLESDHLDTARNGLVGGAPTIQGIALGESGEPTGYWLHRVHPGAAWILPGATWRSSERIPAGDVLHVYDWGQVVEMIRAANALLDDAGLALDTDPRRVARSGATQDAAQIAAVEIAATGAAAPPRPT